MSIVVPVVPVVQAYNIIVVTIKHYVFLECNHYHHNLLAIMNNKVKFVILGDNITCDFH